MKIALMRKLDFWLGIPLTFGVSLVLWPLDRMLNFFKVQAPSTSARRRGRVLFIELSEMGSAILADPALRKVSRNHDVYFVIFKRNAVSLRLLGTVPDDRIFTLRDTSLWALAMDTLKFIYFCRKTKITASVDLELFSRFTALLSAFSGASLRVGFHPLRGEGLYRGFIINRPLAYNPHIHITKNFMALAECLEDPESSPYARRKVEDHEVYIPDPAPNHSLRSRVKSILETSWSASALNTTTQLLIVNANAGDLLPQRRWPSEAFVDLTQKICERFPEVRIGFTGSVSEKPFVDQLVNNIGRSNVASLAGLFSFEELPSLYQFASLIVTNDSGPAHFASACGLKTFVLFGPETPTLYGPLKNATSLTAGLACSPCVSASNHRDSRCADNQCMKQLRPSFVFGEIEKFLNKQKATEPLIRSESEIVVQPISNPS